MGAERRLLQCPDCGVLAVSAGAPVHTHGERSVSFLARTEPLTPEPVEALEEELARVEPWLRKTDWYPMTYMLIPSVLAAADLLALRLEACAAPDRARADVAAERLRELRQHFRRVRPGEWA